jgi:hypothetical protein
MRSASSQFATESAATKCPKTFFVSLSASLKAGFLAATNEQRRQGWFSCGDQRTKKTTQLMKKKESLKYK